ncbi:MAG: DUF2612 domain-containing protein [Nevskiaceae bacterium]|nr:MAG: DUF2612 domain-containing protein [Nevskiaceae bacterium]
MIPDNIDHSAQARGLTATQYRDRIKFLKTLDVFMKEVQDLEDALFKVAALTDIDIATGVNLDVLGDIVGVSRNIDKGILLPFFGFQDTDGGVVFGEEGAAGVGARFLEEGEDYTATSVLQDPEFRLIIRAKIVKNHAVGTNDDILRGLNYIFSGSINLIDDQGGHKVSVGIGRQISYTEKLFIRQLDLLPRPNGVQLGIVLSFGSDGFFGFEDTPNAKGFDEGVFAEEI